jgi:hypothetical protein
MQWKHPGSPVTKSFEVLPLAGKVKLTVFWDSQSALFVHFQKPIQSVNATILNTSVDT